MKFGIVTFPGSNCDYDAYHAVVDALGEEAVYLWHKDHDLQGIGRRDPARRLQLRRLPARRRHRRASAPIMREVVQHAQRGGPVLGICNGFQIACEAGLLPGALLRNASLKFVCAPITLRVENADTLFTSRYERGQLITLPIAHGDGRYSADEETLDRLEGEGQVVFRYAPDRLQAEEAYNPNGSMHDIAGIVNEGGQRARHDAPSGASRGPAAGPADGLPLFESILQRVAA